MKTIKIENLYEVPKNYTGIAEFIYGVKSWHKNGKFHREDGPAIEYDSVTEYKNLLNRWYLEHTCYERISLRKYIVLDYYKGKHNIMWYKLLSKNEVIDYPDIPGLVMDFVVVKTDLLHYMLSSKYKTKTEFNQGFNKNDKKNHNNRKNKCMV